MPLDISSLHPSKAAVQTSLATVYVRLATTGELLDWQSIQDAGALGRVGAQTLSSWIEDESDSSPLSDSDMSVLLDEDIAALTRAIAQHSGWKEPSEPAGYRELGQAIQAAASDVAVAARADMARLRGSLASNYGFLKPTALSKLQDQMSDLSSILGRNYSSELLGEAMKYADPFADARRAIVSPEDVLRSALHAVPETPIEQLQKHLLDEVGKPRFPEVSPYIPPRPEDTVLGRAALDSANHSKETLERVESLVQVIGGLNQTIVNDILPAWNKQVSEGQEQATKSSMEAASSLQWTKWAVIVSVAVAMVATWLQIWVSRDIDAGSTKQLEQSQTIMRNQLAAQNRLIEQQARDAEALRQAIQALRPPAAGSEQRRSSSR